MFMQHPHPLTSFDTKQLVWAQTIGCQHLNSLLLAMLVVICIPKDRVVGSAIHETQLGLGYMPFVWGLCVEGFCSLECSAGWHGVSGLLLLEFLVVASFVNCSYGFLLVRIWCQFPKPRPEPRQQVTLHCTCRVLSCFNLLAKVQMCWERWPRRWSHGRRGLQLLMCVFTNTMLENQWYAKVTMCEKGGPEDEVTREDAWWQPPAM